MTHIEADEQSILVSAKKVFDDALSEAKRVASNNLHDVMTKHLGMSTVHIGHAPKEYVCQVENMIWDIGTLSWVCKLTMMS